MLDNLRLARSALNAKNIIETEDKYELANKALIELYKSYPEAEPEAEDGR
jgi:hypothetical protein